jgi:DNA adenine methylase
VCLLRPDAICFVCGYPCDLYDDALHGWRRVSCAALADGVKKRVEVLWLNQRATEGIDGVLKFNDV